jgi:uncharacterized membrane protein YkoI
MKPQFLLAVLLLAAPLAAQAGPERSGQGAEAQQSGAPIPLSRVLATLAQRYPGKQLNTTMGQVGGRPAYLVQWQLANGRIVTFTVDAQTGQVVGQ